MAVGCRKKTCLHFLRKKFANTGKANVAYKYTGKELDGSTEFYFYDVRYHDANLGRFISADTLIPNSETLWTLIDTRTVTIIRFSVMTLRAISGESPLKKP